MIKEKAHKIIDLVDGACLLMEEEALRARTAGEQEQQHATDDQYLPENQPEI